jgi:hypothetical protein
LISNASIPEEKSTASVKLAQFSAAWIDNIIALRWSTTIERNNVGFEIERRSQFDDHWTTVGFVRGNGTNHKGMEYSFTESLIPDKMIMYRIRQITGDGTSLVSRPLTLLPDQIPNSFRISTNHPNPFRQWTNVDFVLSKPSIVSVRVYNMHGQLVECISDNVELAAGHHVIPFTAWKLNPGMYSILLMTEDGIRSNVMIKTESGYDNRS